MIAPYLYALFFVLVGAFMPATSFAEVKIGAGTVKTYAQPTPASPAVPNGAPTNAAPLPENKPQKASPLARSTAELFRKEIIDLKEALIANALKNVPLRQRPDFQKKLAGEIRVDKILNLYALTLEKYYTEAELKALRTFMADDTNRQMLEKLPTVLGQMGLNRQEYLNIVLENFLRRELLEKLEKGEPTILTPQ